MSRLKYKHEIPSYEEKAKVLRENGWDTWYNDDNWIKTEWHRQGKKIDMMGRTTDSAYTIENNPDPIDDLVQVKSLNEEDFRYRSWTTVTRFLATGLQGVEIREMPSND